MNKFCEITRPKHTKTIELLSSDTEQLRVSTQEKTNLLRHIGCTIHQLPRYTACVPGMCRGMPRNDECLKSFALKLRHCGRKNRTESINCSKYFLDQSIQKISSHPNASGIQPYSRLYMLIHTFLLFLPALTMMMLVCVRRVHKAVSCVHGTIVHRYFTNSGRIKGMSSFYMYSMCSTSSFYCLDLLLIEIRYLCIFIQYNLNKKMNWKNYQDHHHYECRPGDLPP